MLECLYIVVWAFTCILFIYFNACLLQLCKYICTFCIYLNRWKIFKIVFLLMLPRVLMSLLSVWGGQNDTSSLRNFSVRESGLVSLRTRLYVSILVGPCTFQDDRCCTNLYSPLSNFSGGLIDRGIGSSPEIPNLGGGNKLK